MGIYEYTCVWVGDACEREREREYVGVRRRDE